MEVDIPGTKDTASMEVDCSECSVAAVPSPPRPSNLPLHVSWDALDQFNENIGFILMCTGDHQRISVVYRQLWFSPYLYAMARGLLRTRYMEIDVHDVPSEAMERILDFYDELTRDQAFWPVSIGLTRTSISDLKRYGVLLGATEMITFLEKFSHQETLYRQARTTRPDRKRQCEVADVDLRSSLGSELESRKRREYNASR